MNLPDSINRGVHAYGFVEPSEIQQKAVVPIKEGRSVLAQAQSGTGKTGAFALGILCRIDETVNAIQAIVLAPTRELAIQIHDVISNLAKYTNITSHVFIGGVNIAEDRKVLQTGVHILIGTPGRILQICNPSKMDELRKKGSKEETTKSYDKRGVNLVSLKSLVIDEADQMLSKGFTDSVAAIFQSTPQEAQIVLVSATFTKEVETLSKKLMTDPVCIRVKDEELTLEGIRQTIGSIDPNEKLTFLTQLLKLFQSSLVIIYCQRIDSCETVYKALLDLNFPVKAIHGKMAQSERNAIMMEFRNSNVRIIVTTDLLARGIDIQSLGIVINYELPKERESYLHRVGRAGRFGKKGLAINICSTEDDIAIIQEIEKTYGTKMEKLTKDIVHEWSVGRSEEDEDD